MNRSKTTVNVMAPLVIGNPADMNSASSLAGWNQFQMQLAAIKALGAEAVSTDIWWGLIEPQDGVFSWSYYDRVAACIFNAGLKWVPILSFHKCGGNIGDDVDVPLPNWLWNKLAKRSRTRDVRSLQFVSEQGNASPEYVSFWATDLVLDLYKRVMQAFQAHYAPCASEIAELNISLGPSGELRYPSYNKHDVGTDYPSRGALQCYSSLARKSFTEFTMRKYGGMAGLNKAWGKPLDPSGHKIEPPRNAAAFFASGGHHNTQYGRDLFDWYSDSLIEHGRKVMSAAIGVFGATEAPFRAIELGAKVPGVHWRVGTDNHNFWRKAVLQLSNQVIFADRLAELAAGLIRSSNNEWRQEFNGSGYAPLISLFADLDKMHGAGVVLHFTCLEMPDGGGGVHVSSMAESLVGWVAAEASRQGVCIKGENALGPNLLGRESYQRIRSHLALPGSSGLYRGITYLRMSDILATEMGRCEFAFTAHLASAQPLNFAA